MYKLDDVSSFNCSILALNESDFELVRVFTRCRCTGFTFLRGCIDFGYLYLGIERSGDLVNLLRNNASAVRTPADEDDDNLR